MKKYENISVFGIIAAILSVLLSVQSVLAAPTEANITAETPEAYSWTPTQQTTNIFGGNVSQVNVSAVQVTDKWVGFWGEVSGSIVLADSSGNYFYQWTINDPTGSVVYVCNYTVSDWGTLSPLNVSSGYLPSFLLEGHDSFNNTFINQETFTSPTLTVNNANYTYTWQGGSQGSTFKTYALYADSGAALVWAGNVAADQTSFKGTVTADYQILAGVDTRGAQETFYFYLELA